MDAKADRGVDICGDVTIQEIQAAISRRAPKLVICSNLLEHVVDRPAVVTLLSSIVGPGGFLLLTVPRSYPFHADPIDTGFRPTPEEIASMFVEYNTLSKAIVVGETFAERIARHPKMLLTVPFRLLFRFKGYPAWRNQFDMLNWMFRPLTVSAVLLQRKSSPMKPLAEVAKTHKGAVTLPTVNVRLCAPATTTRRVLTAAPQKARCLQPS